MLKVIILAAVLALAMAQTPVKSGVPFRGASPFRTWMYYSIPASEATINYVQIVATVDSGIPFFYVGLNALPTFTRNIFRFENATAGSEIVTYVTNPNVNLHSGKITEGTLYLGVFGYRDTKYTITLNSQGPVPLDNGQIVTTTFPLARESGYIFYSFTVEPDLKQFQVVAQLGVFSSFYFFVNNSTTDYPVAENYPQYVSTSRIVNGAWHACLELDASYPGTYHLSVTPSQSNYTTTVQYQPNSIGNCDFEQDESGRLAVN